MSSFPFPLTEPILFERCYHEDTSGNGNDLAHFAEVEDDVISRSDIVHLCGREESGGESIVTVGLQSTTVKKITHKYCQAVMEVRKCSLLLYPLHSLSLSSSNLYNTTSAGNRTYCWSEHFWKPLRILIISPDLDHSGAQIPTLQVLQVRRAWVWTVFQTLNQHWHLLMSVSTAFRPL